MKSAPFLIISSIVLACKSFLSADQVDKQIEVFKVVNDTELEICIYSTDQQSSSLKPALVLFFGGGWIKGGPGQFARQAEELAADGIVVITPDYRTKNKYGTTPFESVMDAKSAMRWVYANAERLHLDTERIAAGGGSAGGHLAAATAFIDGLNDPGDAPGARVKPSLLVLFNPVVHNGPGRGSYGYERIGERYMEISPFHNIREESPATLFMLGTEDKLIPVSVAQQFKASVEESGSECELVLYEGQGHGFFNYNGGTNPYYDKTLETTRNFLRKHGYLPR